MPDPDRSKLPIRRPQFHGVAGRTLEGSQPDWNQIGHIRPPEGVPNVLLVLIDDAGFGNPTTFGGPGNTPTFSRLADNGLRYNRFHVTALCSPTRAALLTGRNHHTVGFGMVADMSCASPGYSAFLPKDCAPFPKMLQENGYSTARFGKWHLTPDDQQGAAGPFDRWPNAWGFDYFWGFLTGEAGQYDPLLVENTTIAGVPRGNDGERYYFPDDMADRAIGWIHGVRARTRPSRGSRTSRPGVATPRTTCRRPGRTSTPESSTRGGRQAPRADLRAAEGAWRDPFRR